VQGLPAPRKSPAGGSSGAIASILLSEAPRLSLRALWAFMGPRLRAHPRLLGALAVLLLVSLALTLSGPLLLREFIDRSLGTEQGGMAGIAGAFLAVALGTQAVGVAMAWVATDLSSRTTNELRRELTDHVLQLDMGFHRRTPPGELIERVDGDVGQLGVLLGNFAPQMAQESLLLCGVLGLLWGIDTRLGAVLTAYAVVALMILGRLRHLGVSAWENVREANAKVTGFQEELLGSTEDVRPNGATEHVLIRFLGLSRTYFWAAVRAGTVSGTTTVVGLGLFGASQSIALGLGALMLARGEITLGTVYLLTQYTAYLSGPIDGFTYRVRYLQQATAALNRVARLTAARPAVASPPDPANLPAGPLAVEFDRVGFAYEEGKRVLKDLLLQLPAGRRLGLVGRTGSGKTTLGRLLARQYDASSGTVRVGGVPVADTDLEALRDRVAVVTQEVQLFTATVRENIALFRDLPDADLLQVLGEVGLSEWLAAQPEGLDGELDPRSLSAGEAQLLALARTLLRDPGVVLLDEASARLDPATEGRLQLAVNRLLEGRTAIVIAHRLSTLDRMDDIAVMEDGRIVEHGPRESLVADPDSRFSRLLDLYRNEVLA
jgi:ATP-binding cassette, subfamily B, bacterial